MVPRLPRKNPHDDAFSRAAARWVDAPLTHLASENGSGQPAADGEPVTKPGWTEPRGLAAIAIVVAAYFALVHFGLSLDAPWNSLLGIASGLALAALLLCDRARWPLLCGALVLTSVAAYLSTDLSTGTAVNLGVAHTLAALIPASALAFLSSRGDHLHTSREVWYFVGLVVAGAWLAGLAAGAVPHSGLNLWHETLRSALTDIAGMLVVVPVLLSLVGPDRQRPDRRRAGEAVVLMFGLVGLSTLVLFTPEASVLPLLHLPYVVLPFLIWASLRCGTIVSRLALALFAGMALAATASGLGPFVPVSQPQWAEALELQGFVSVTAGVLLALSVALAERERLTSSLDEQRRFDAAIVENLVQGVIACDAEGRLTLITPAAERLLGVSAADAFRGEAETLIDPGTGRILPPHELPLARALTGERLQNEELLIARADEPERLLSFTAQPILAGGASIGAVATIQDVTEQRRSEGALAHLAAIVGSSSDAIVATALDGTIVSWNAAAERMYGYTAGEAAGRPMTLVVPPERRDEHRGLIGRLRRGERIEQFETARTTKAGEAIDISVTMSLVTDQRGAVVGVSEISRDISERLRDARRVREVERRFQRAFEDSALGMVIVGSTPANHGVILDVNDALCRLVGRPREELLGTDTFDTLMHPGDAPAMRPRIDGLIAGHVDSLESEHRMQGPGGAELVVKNTMSVIRDDDGRPIYRISQVQDFTARVAAEQKLRSVARHFEVSHDLMCTVRTSDGRFEDLNGSWTETLGWSIEELRARPFLDFVHPDDREATRAEAATLVSNGRSLRFRNRYQAADGRWLWLEWSSKAVLEEGLIYAAARDVTEQEHSLRALEEAESRFRGAFENAGSGMALVGVADGYSGRFLDVNDALCNLTGRSRSELLQMTFAEITHPDDLVTTARDLRRLLARDTPYTQAEMRIVGEGGKNVWTAATSSLVRCERGTPRYRVLQLSDITAHKQSESQLRVLAETDALTGMFNRRRFEEEAERELALSARHHTQGALMLMDLDHFKTVNDTLGHAGGDELLVRVAQLLKERLRHTDIQARFGGDEFALLLPHTAPDQATRVAAELLAAMRESAFIQTPRGTRRATVTIGIALFGADHHERNLDDLFAKADLALYEAKESGRDRAAVFRDRGRGRPRGSGLTKAGEIRAAIEEDRMVLYAQPIVPLQAPSPPQYELLVRMINSDGDLLLPAGFLETAERFGVIRELDRWVTTQAMRLLASEQTAGRETHFDVNLSAKSISDPELPGFIARRLADCGADPSGLTFEITETGAIIDLEQARAFVRALHDLGCSLALDDFGAGFASFYNLKHLDFDYLKIDGEFGRYLPTNTTDQLVVRSTVDIARGLNKKTIAEYVTDAETVALLREYGVDYVQGNYLGEPRPIDELNTDELYPTAA